MSKIVIIGTQGAGKTCYFYGMLSKLQIGVGGFSLPIDGQKHPQLRNAIKRLGDIKLPLGERWPQANTEMEKYELDLMLNFKKLDTIEWVDYPGEKVTYGDKDFISLLKDADCLFICVDGSLLKEGTPEDIDDLVYDFIQESGADLCNALNHAAVVNENGLPPICILITKYDEVSPALRNLESIKEFAKKCFNPLFAEGQGAKRMVTICPVTLGKEIADGGKLRPVNVQMPICFAAYLMQYRLVSAMISQINDEVAKREAEEASYREASFLGRLIRPKPQPLSEEQKKTLAEEVARLKAPLDALLAEVRKFPLIIDGQDVAWPD